jgi:SAM-dependent methyltransferase
MDKSFRDNLKQAYNTEAQQRDAGTIQTWKIEERAGFLFLLKNEHKRTLLEIGAGTGKDSLFFKEKGMETTSIDLSPEMVAFCRQKGLTAYTMDMTELIFPEGTYDAVYALNSLLHLTKDELPKVLSLISTVLTPTGLFYMGVYGGYEFEGVRENDRCIPKRFFSFFTDEHLQQVVLEVFDIAYFKPIPLEKEDKLHFQSLILRKRKDSVPRI